MIRTLSLLVFLAAACAPPDEAGFTRAPPAEEPPPPPPPPPPPRPLYAHARDVLYRVDGGDLETVGPFTIDGALVDVTDIAIKSDGSAVAAAGGGLYTLDLDSGALTGFTPTARAAVGLEYARVDGREQLLLLVADPTSIATADGEELARFPGDLFPSGDVAALGRSVYATLFGSGAAPGDHLYRLDLDTLAVDRVGTLDRSFVYGLAARGLGLLGFTAQGEIVEIDPATAATGEPSVSRVSFWGASGG